MKTQVQRTFRMAAVVALSAVCGRADVAQPTFVPDCPRAGETSAWYPFSEGEVGTEWTSPNPEQTGNDGRKYSQLPFVNNVVDSADTMPVWAAIAGTGRVRVSDDVPGAYVFASRSATVPMATAWRALVLPQVDSGNFSYLYINDLPAYTLSAPDAFTLEFFFRVQEGWTTSGYLCWWDFLEGKSSLGRVFVCAPAQGQPKGVRAYCAYADPIGGTNVSAQVNQIVYTADTAFNDGAWHHLAVVFEQKTAKGELGTARLILDYQPLVGEIRLPRPADYGRSPTELVRSFRLGDGVWGGAVAGLRVTPRALTADELLRASDSVTGVARADTIALYTFDDLPVGTELTHETANLKDPVRPSWPGLFPNKAGTKGYKSTGESAELGTKLNASGATSTIEFSSVADVPGRYVYDGLTAPVPLCDLRASLEAQGKGSRPADSPNLANWAFLHGLAGDLHRADSYTVEFFAKFETEAGLFLFYDQGQQEQNRVTLERDTSGKVRLSFYKKANVTVAYPGGKTSLRDGMWHHYALVYRADGAGSATGRLTLYCDYTLVSEELAVSKDLAYVADVFRLFEGNQKMRLSAFRATAATLDPSEFLYASDSAVGLMPDQAWSWRFDGAIGGLLSAADATAAAVDDGQYVFADAHAFQGTVSGTPCYAAPVFAGSRYVQGEKEGRNRSAVALSGTDGVASDVAGVLCAPGRVFTAEALVAVEAAGPAVVLAGRDLSGQDAWGLSLSEDGALNVFVHLVDGSLVSRVLVANAVDAAHGVALVGDLANRSVRAYVDGVLKAEIGVADCPRPIALDAVRVVVGEGVKGRIDEVRMTRAVQTPDQFARIERKGLALVIR